MVKKSNPTTTALGRDPSTDPIATGVFAFEGGWESDLRDPWSIESMLRTLQAIGEFKCIRRNVATVPELEHYLDKWLQKRYAGYQVGYFGFHGGPGSLWLGGKRYVSLEDLEARIVGRAQGRIIHFGSCSVMGVGESRLKAFQENTGARAVIGYRTDVDSDLNWAAFEILLLEALSRYRQIGAPDLSTGSPTERSRSGGAGVAIVQFSAAVSEATMERADVLKNYAAFEAMRAELEASHLGKFAVLHDGQLVGTYVSVREARTAGDAHCGVGNFTTQEIRAEPIELGTMAAALA